MKKIFALTVLLLSLCEAVLGQTLGNLVDLRTALKDNLGIDSNATTAFYSNRKLDRFLNRGLCFVERSTKMNQARVSWNLDGYSFTLGDTISFNGVENVFVVPSAGVLGVDGLSKKMISEFDPSLKSGTGMSEIYDVWSKKITTAPTPGKAGTIFADVWKISSPLSGDSSTVSLPREARELVVQYAFYLCLRSEYRFQEAASEWQVFMTMFQVITGISLKASEPLNPDKL